MIGTLLANRYRIDAPLGEGGMGVVYRAHDTMLNRPVALKMLSPHLIGDEGVRRLLREAQAAAQLTHPNIVSVYDVIDTADTRLIVMEYVDGRPLAELIPMDVPRAIDTVTQVCAALQYAHARGIVHRDIKPENIVVTTGGTAKLMDFGLARSEGRSRMTQSGLIVGTVAYMAPEQVLGGTVDARTDLYSLGCVLYETLTGRKPFGGEDPFTVLSQQVNVTPVAPRWHNDAIPPTLDAVVMRLLAKDPAERYPSATAVIEALDLAVSVAAGDVPETGAAPAGTATRTTLLEHIVRGKLVGRSAELAELREHLDRMLSGEGRLVLVSGEPGIGKTRLSEELAVYAHLRGARVLRGHCYEQDVGVPYLPFVESLRQLLHQAGDSLQQLGDRVSDLARLLPEASRARTAGPALTPEDERVRAFEAAAQWVSLASRAHPLVFLLDDLHWADQASLRLLHHLARSTRTDRVLITGTYREMELDTEHPLNDAISQMNRERLFYRLPLRRLSEEDTRALLSGLFDVETSQELAGAIHRETEGNPFFIEEVVKALVEEGKIYREAGRWQRLEIEQLEIPQSVKAAIGRRVQKASETSKRVLTIAAVIGREFDPDILVKISQLDEDTVLDALDEAVRLQVIRETKVGRETGYAFEHALIRQTLYNNLNARRRARLHQQVGDAMETMYGTRLDDHLEALAYHFGEAGTPSKGVDYNVRAARKAAGLFALEEAERRLHVAFELADSADDSGTRSAVLEHLGDLYLLLQDNRAADAYRRALQAVTPADGRTTPDMLRLYCRIAEAGAGWWSEPPPDASQLVHAAADGLADGPDVPLKARALSLVAIYRLRTGDTEGARPFAEHAVEVAAGLNDATELSMAYRAKAMVHRYSNEWEQFRQTVQQRTALLGGGLTAQDIDIYIDLIFSYVNTNDLATAERTAQEFLDLAQRLHSPSATYRAHGTLANTLFLNGKWDESLDAAARAIELGRHVGDRGWFASRPIHRSAEILAARGRDEEARAQLAALDTHPEPTPPEHTGARQFALMIALEHRDVDAVNRLLVRVEREQPRCHSCAFTRGLVLGEAHALLGNLEAAQTRLTAAEASKPAVASLTDVGDIAHLRGTISRLKGDLHVAIAHYEEALTSRATLRGRSGATYTSGGFYTALYLEEIAALYLQRNRPGDAAHGRDLAQQALTAYRALGAARFEARAQALLEAHPVP